MPKQMRWIGAPRESVESIWDLAPTDASLGAVFHEHAIAKAFTLWASLKQHASARPKRKTKKQEPPAPDALPKLATADDWARAGLDTSLEAAVFAWPDRERGGLIVVPMRDRALFRTAFRATTRTDGAREIDTLPNGYSCVIAAERFLCAKSLQDIDAAAAPHSSKVAYGGEHLGPDDTGDVEIFATKNAPQIAGMVEAAKDYGKVSAGITSIRIREDGAALRVHVPGLMVSQVAKSLAGAAPPSDKPPAAGADSVIHVHIDPVAMASEDKDLDPEEKHELLEQLTGDMEATTSGKGLFGAHAELEIKDEARVLAYIKKKCAESAGKLISDYRNVTVTDRGCKAEFDPKLVVVSILREPIPISSEVSNHKLILTAGNGRAPAPNEHTLNSVIPESDAMFALMDPEAIVAFTQSPFLGPDIGAGAEFSKISSLVKDEVADGIDDFNDIAAHVAQAHVSGRVEEDGVVMSAGFVTFQRDPPEVRAAYESALTARAANDINAYHARLAEIERRYPKSLAARRAAAVRTTGPLLGAGTIGFGTLGVWLDVLGGLLEMGPEK
jgi:hypothetical protein